MNTEDIIALKTACLQNPKNAQLQLEFEQALNALDEQQQRKVTEELAFIDTFWTGTAPVQDVNPSGNLRAGFYQFLEEQKSESKTKVTESQTFWQWLAQKNQLIQPAFQFALVCVVFLAGMGAQSVFQLDDTVAVGDLEQQVEELNVMVALSLLDKPSAAERLSGVSYSGRSSYISESLTTELLRLLETDRSSAVRLAIIETLAARRMVQAIEQQLLEVVLVQENTLVQLQLVALLKQQGSQKLQNALVDLADDPRLHEEVKQDLFNNNQSQSI